MPNLADPHIAAHLMPLQGPAFTPGLTARPEEVAAERHWGALVDARLIGAIPAFSADHRAAVEAMERVFGIATYRDYPARAHASSGSAR